MFNLLNEVIRAAERLNEAEQRFKDAEAAHEAAGEKRRLAWEHQNDREGEFYDATLRLKKNLAEGGSA